MKHGWFRFDLLYFWIIVLIASIYVYVLPLPDKEFDIDYSCVLKANDKRGTPIGCLMVPDIGPDAKQARKIHVPALEDVPDGLIMSLLDSEDRTYYDPLFNFLGINWRGLTRAIIHAGTQGGGSGIIQQEAKLFLFGPDPTQHNANRKLTEFILSANLDHTYSRDRLLLTYLNNVPFTHQATGFRTAAGLYFGKDLRKLSLDEYATLVGLLRNPSIYTRTNEAAKSQRDRVLKALLTNEDVSKETYVWLLRKPVNLKTLDPLRRNKPFFSESQNDYESYFTTYVTREVRQLLPNLEGSPKTLNGFTIYTTYLPSVQRAAEQATQEALARMPAEFREQVQLGLVAVEPQTGKIRAMIGCNPYLPQLGGSGLNYALRAHQAGSTFKPFAYGAYLTHPSVTLNTRLPDRPMSPFDWNPNNYSGTYSGADVPIQTCLAQSLNIPTANLVKQRYISLTQLSRFAQRAGIETPQPKVPSAVLGTGSVTPLELAGAYGTLANKGVSRPPFAVLSMFDGDRRVYLRPGYRNRKKASVSPKAATLLQTALRAVVRSGGTANRVTEWYQETTAFGKTGTTTDYRDAWFVGVSPQKQLSTAIWLGYPKHDQPLPAGFNTGGSTAAPLWGMMMQYCR